MIIDDRIALRLFDKMELLDEALGDQQGVIQASEGRRHIRGLVNDAVKWAGPKILPGMANTRRDALKEEDGSRIDVLVVLGVDMKVGQCKADA
jgi:hypothetical protein